jgi:hypothetical protein
MNKRILPALLICIVLLPSRAQQPQIPDELNTVFQYILNDEYLELFGDSSKAYQFRPVNWSIYDFGNDGDIEVFLHLYPHFRQTATIQIYQIKKSGQIKRFKESLAPGFLTQQTDEYFDAHHGGFAADIKAGNMQDEKMAMSLVKSSVKFKMNVLRFKNFLHTDNRLDNGSFVDLTHLDYPDTLDNCSILQVERPGRIASGKLSGAIGDYFVAEMSEHIFVYLISGYDELGFLDKALTIIKKPKDYSKLEWQNEQIGYLTTTGRFKEIKL